MILALKRYIARRSRMKRARLVMQELNLTENDRILDLGGGKGRHFASVFPFRKNVWIGCHSQENLHFASEKYGFNTVLLDGCDDRLPFEDKAFDVVFCSSVIEHVTGPKDEAVGLFKTDGARFVTQALPHQERFAREIQRIAKRYYVQTPNRLFPFEMHSWLPGLGYLPTHWQWQVLRVSNHFWPQREENPDWALLTYRQMRALFPDATLKVERFAGLVKSVIAIGGTQIKACPRNPSP